MLGQIENERHGARLDEKLPIGSNAFDEVYKEMGKKLNPPSSGSDKLDNSPDNILPKFPKSEPLPEPRFPKGEPMPSPKFPRIDEPMPKAPPKIDDTLPKYPKHGESGPKLPVEKDGDANGRSTDRQPGGRSQSGEATPRERPKTDCGFGGRNHSDGSSDLNTRRSSGGAERQAPSDLKPRTGQQGNVMNQFPTVELFAH